MRKVLNRDVSQRENLTLVVLELGAVLDNALADGVKVFDFTVPEVGQQCLETCDIFLFSICSEPFIRAKLKQDLVICAGKRRLVSSFAKKTATIGLVN